ncbi:cytochrome c oxidase subunit II [Aciduricibacillus chroicocephali]|uniref:Cytochrome c oxidase subunit 2 n=1 Tax=Aciduricibacillus chroicocephali TaxID=3054939 RepID=A0ABY9L1H8_9BACI|nr:cytochrome c oxidase subunit II [Bacillaceae bacterium 44XB]
MRSAFGKMKTAFLLAVTALILAGCGKENLTALVPKGVGAQKSMDLIILTTAVMTLVFLIVIILFVVVLVRYRRKKGQEDYIPEQVEGNKTLEIVWTVIPIILVLVMAVPTVVYTFELADDSKAKDHINIDVKGNQYWWHFDYKGEKIQTSQDLYIPTGEKVYVHLLSNDVTHSFWIPSISGKLDVNPENENTMYIEANEEGVYWGKCAEFCGPSHSLMDFKVVAVSPDKYKQWVKDMQNFDPKKFKPDTQVAQEGQKLFEEKSCIACHAIGPSPVATGPNLTDFGNREKYAGILEPTKENLVKWIVDPEKEKPGNKMTGKYPKVTEEEAGKIAEYLMQLKPSSVTPETVSK